MTIKGVDTSQGLLGATITNFETLTNGNWSHVQIGDGTVTINPDKSVTFQVVSNGRSYIQWNGLRTTTDPYKLIIFRENLVNATDARILTITGTSPSISSTNWTDETLEIDITPSDMSINFLIGIGTNTTTLGAHSYTLKGIQFADPANYPPASSSGRKRKLIRL